MPKITINAQTLDKLIVNSFISPLPLKEEDRVKVNGLNGTKLLSFRYNDRELNTNCIFLKTTDLRADLRTLADFVKPNL